MEVVGRGRVMSGSKWVSKRGVEVAIVQLSFPELVGTRRTPSL